MGRIKKNHDLIHEIVRVSQRKHVPSLLAYVLIMLFATAAVLFYTNIALYEEKIYYSESNHHTLVAGDVIIRTFPTNCVGWENSEAAKDIDLLSTSPSSSFNEKNSAYYKNSSVARGNEYEMISHELICDSFDLANNIPPEAIDIAGNLSFSFASDTYVGNEDIVVFSYSLDGGDNWTPVDSFALLKEMNNEMNEGYWTYPVPDLSQVLNNDSFLVRVEYIAEPTEKNVAAYVDGITLDIHYFEEDFPEGKPKKVDMKNKDGMPFWTAPIVEVEVEKESAFKYLGVATEKREVKSIQLTHPDGSVGEPNTIIERKSENGAIQDEYKIQPDNFDEPGIYKATFAIEEDGVVKETVEEFAWGTLSINNAKSVYQPNETAHIGISAFNAEGDFVCDADLSLQITDPKGKIKTITTNDEIIRSDKCGPNIPTTSADYITSIDNLSAGKYKLNLSGMIDGKSYTTTEYFEVDKNTPFNITRIGPSRIYPIVEYEMFIEVVPKEDYFGIVTETIPNLIEILEINENGSISSIDESNNKISWDVDWRKGKAYTLSYKFESPSLVDHHFQLGPSEFPDFQTKENKTDPLAEMVGWTEPKQWHVESDTVATKNHKSYSNEIDENRIEIIDEKSIRYREKNGEFKDRIFSKDSFFKDSSDNWHTTETQLDIMDGGNNDVTFNVNGKEFVLKPALVINGKTELVDNLSPDYRSQLQMRLEVQKIDQGNKWTHVFFRTPEIEAVEFLVESNNHTVTVVDENYLLIDEQLLLNFTDLVESGFNITVTPKKITVTGLKDGWNILDPTDSFYSTAADDGEISYSPPSTYNVTSGSTTSRIAYVGPINQTVRSYLSFDTSAISDSATVTASDVNIYADSYTKDKPLSTNYSIKYYSGINCIGSFSTADWNSCSTYQGTLDWANTAGWKSKSLSSPASSVNLTGDTDFRLVDNFGYSGTENKTARMRQTEASFTTYDPYLDVTYTTGIDVSGNVYNENSTTALTECDGSTNMINLRVQSTTYTTTCNDSTGAFTFSGVSSPSTNEAMILWIEGQSPDGTTANQYSGSGNVTGLTIQENALTIHNDSGLEEISNADLDTYDNGNDSDINYTVTSSNLTVEDGHRLLVKGVSYVPGGTITTSPASSQSAMDGDIYMEASAVLNMGTNALSIGGDFTSAGGITFTVSSGQTTTFTGTDTGFSIEAEDDFQNVTFNGSGGQWSFNAGADINDDLTVTAGEIELGGTTIVTDNITINGGTLDVTSNNYALSTTGSWDIDSGNFYANAGTVTFNESLFTETIDGDGTGTDAFYNLAFDDKGVSTQWSITGALDIENNITITGGNLNNSAGSYSINVRGSWANNDSYTRGTETVTFDGTSGTYTIDGDSPGNDDFYNVVINDSGGAGEWQLTSQPLQIDGNLTITDGIFNLNNYDVYIAGNLNKTGGSIDMDQASDFLNLTGNLTVTGSDSPVDVIIAGSWYVYGNITISGDNTWGFGGSGYPTFYPLGNSDTTLSVTGLNNTFYSGNGEFRLLKSSSSAKLTLNSDLDTNHFNHYEGVLDINGYDLVIRNIFWIQSGANITMASGSITAGVTNYTPSSVPIFDYQAGATENITGGTIKVYGNGHATEGIAIFSNGSNFTPTGGTFQIFEGGTSTNSHIFIEETDAADFNFWNLTIGDGTNTKTVDILATSEVVDIDGDFTVSANATFETNGIAMEVAGDWDNNGTFTHDSNTITFDASDTDNIISAGSSDFNNLTFQGSDGSGDWLFRNDNATITGTLDVDTSDNMNIFPGRVVEWTGTTFTLDGSIGSSSDGIFSIDSTTTLPTTGTITSYVRFNASNGNTTIMPNRTYGSDVIIYSDSASARIITPSSGIHNITGNFSIETGLGNTTFAGNTNNPVINIGGDVSATDPLLGGSQIIVSGTGTWTVTGDFDLTYLTYTATTGNTLEMDGTGKYITSNVQALQNFEVSTGTIINADAMDVNGTFVVSGGTFDHNSGTGNINVAGDFTIANGANWIGTDVYSIILDGDLTLTDNNTTPVELSLLQIGASPDTTDLASDIAAKGVIVPTGDVFNSHGYDMTLGGNGLSVTGTLDLTDDVETDETFITTDGDVSFNSGASVTEDQSTITFDAASGTDNIFNGGTQDFYNLVINGTVTVEVEDAIDVDGDLTITDGTLDVVSGENNSINLAGSWDNDDTFEARSGTVTFDATSGTHTIDADGTGTDTFYDITFNDSAGSAHWDLTGALDVANDLAITGGTLDNSASSYNINIGGGWDNDDAYTRGTETVTFDGTSGTHSIEADSPSDDDFYNVVINDSAGSAEWNLTSQPMVVDGNLTITDGILDLNNYDMSVVGNLNKTGGNLEVNESGDSLLIYGDFTVSGNDGSPTFSDGSIVIEGDVDISNDNTFECVASGWPTFRMQGGADSTISVTGANNNFGTGTEFCAFTNQKNTGYTVQQLSDIDGTTFYFANGIWDVNGYTATFSDKVQIDTFGELKMSSGTFTVGRNGSDGDNRAPLSFFNGSSEDITGGTIEIYGSNHSTYGIFFAEDGSTFTPTGGTVKFLGTDSLNTLYITEAGAADFNFHNLEISDGTNAKTLDVNTAATIPIDINGNLTINANGTFDTNTEAVEVAGNWTNNGTFTADSGTVTLDGSSTQTMSGTMTSTSSFYDLTITNSSGSYTGCDTAFTPGVDFATSATSTNTYTVTTANAKVEYNSGSTYTFNNINWVGTSGNEVIFRNSNLTSGTWLLNVSGTQTAVSYVSVARSDASSGNEIDASDGTNINCGNNVNWLFSSFTVSGNAYNKNTTTALTACDGATENLALRVESTTYTTECNNSTGAYTFTGVTEPSASEPMIIWIDEETEYGSTINKYSGTGNITGIIVEENALTIHNDSAVAVSNTDLDTYDNNDDADINYTVTTSNLTLEDGCRIIIKASENFTPGGTVTTSPAAAVADMDGDIYMETGATLNMAANALSIGGDFSTAGTITFTATSGQTTTFTATSGATYTVEAEDAWENLVFNGGATTDWGFDSAATVNGNLTITSGEINLGGNSVFANDVIIGANGNLDSVKFSNYDFSVGGSWDNDGDFDCWECTVTFNATSGTETIDGEGTGTSLFDTITFNDGGGGTTWDLTSALETGTGGSLNILGGTLDANGYTITALGHWDNDDTFIHGNNLVYFSHALSGYNIDADGTGTDSFYDVTFGGAVSGVASLTTDMDIDNNLLIQSGGSLSLNGTHTLYVGGNFYNGGRFTESTGTVVMDGGAGTHWINTSEAESAEYGDFYNLTYDDGAAGATYKTYYPLDADNDITITGGDLNMNGGQTYYLTSNTTDAETNQRRITTADPAGTASDSARCTDNGDNHEKDFCVFFPTGTNTSWTTTEPSTFQSRSYMLNNGQAINGRYASGDWTIDVTRELTEGSCAYDNYSIYSRLWKTDADLSNPVAISNWVGKTTGDTLGAVDDIITLTGLGEVVLEDQILAVEFMVKYGNAFCISGSDPTYIDFRVNEGGSKQKVNTPVFTPQINVGGSWDNDDTFTHANGTVVFDPASGTKTINSTGATDDDFYDVIINDGGGTGTVQLAGTNIQVDHNFTLEDGTYDFNNLFTYVDNDFTKTGGNLEMDQSSDILDVAGNFTVSGDGGSSSLTNGVFAVGGDVTISNNNVFQMGHASNYPVFSMDGAVSKNISVSGTGNYFGITGAIGEFDIDKTGGAVVNVSSDLDIWNLVHNTGGLNIESNYTVNADGQYVGFGGTLTMSDGTLSVGSDNLAPGSYANFYVASGWTEAITGGTIEIDGIGHATNEVAYFANGSVFTPTGGSFKFIGNDNSTFQVAEADAADFNFYDLTIGDGSNTQTVDIDTAATIPIEVTNDVFIAANATFDTNTETVEAGNDWDNDGTFVGDTGEVVFDASDTGNNISAGTGTYNDVTFQGGDGSGGWGIQNDNMAIAGAIDVDTDDSVVIYSGRNVTWTGASFTLDGSITGSTGRLIIDSSTVIPTTGTLTCITRFDASNGNTTIMPNRDYGTVEIYNLSGTNRTITPLAGTHNVNGNFTLGPGTNNVIFNANTNDPTMNITGNISNNLSLGGIPSLYSGSDKWTIGGDIDLSGGTLSTETGNTFAINSGISIITSNGNSFLNIEVDNGGNLIHSDALDINGTFTVESGGNAAQSSIYNINIAGDFTLQSSSTFTASASSGDLILDGDLTLTDNNVTKQDLGDLQIGTSPDTTDLASDIAAKGITVNSGDVFYSNGYDMLIGSYGVTVNGTMDLTDDVETDETFISTLGSFTVNSGATFVENQSTVTFTDTSGTDNLDIDSSSALYNLVIDDGGGGSLVVNLSSSTVDINNDVTITDGELDLNTNTLYVGGSWANNDSLIHLGGTVEFNATSGTKTVDADSPNDDNFYHVIFDDNGGSAHWNLTSQPMQVDGNLTITDGIFDPNNYDTYVAGNFLKTGGDLMMDQDSSEINVEGNFTISGDDGSSDLSDGYYYVGGNVAISNSNTFVMGGAATAAVFYMDGTTNTTLSITGTGNHFGSSTDQGYLRIDKTDSTDKVTLLSDAQSLHCISDEGVLVINGQTLTCQGVYYGYSGSSIEMASGTMAIGRDGYNGGSSAPWSVQTGWTEAISGGTITVDGGEHATYGNAYFANGSNFTPTGGTFQLIGNDTASILVSETGAADHNFWNLTLGDITNTKTVEIDTGTVNALDVNGDLTINRNTTFDCNSENIEVAGDFINDGTFTEDTGTVTMNGGAGTHWIDTSGALSDAASDFYNLEFNDGGAGATYKTVYDLNVNNDLDITGGDLNMNSTQTWYLTSDNTNAVTNNRRLNTTDPGGTANDTATCNDNTSNQQNTYCVLYPTGTNYSWGSQPTTIQQRGYMLSDNQGLSGHFDSGVWTVNATTLGNNGYWSYTNNNLYARLWKADTSLGSETAITDWRVSGTDVTASVVDHTFSFGSLDEVILDNEVIYIEFAIFLGNGIHAIGSGETYYNLRVNEGGTKQKLNTPVFSPHIFVGHDWTNNDTFTAANGKVVLDGTTTQALSGTMTTTSAFNDLEITNTSGSYSGCDSSFTPGVDFAASATINGEFNITTGDVKVEYNSGSTYTANDINWDGGAYGDEIIFRNSALGSGTWLLDVTGTQTSVKYVDVGRSDATSGDLIESWHISNVDCNNTSNWDFDSLTFSISDTSIGFGDLTSANARWANGAATGSVSKQLAHTMSVRAGGDDGYTLTYYGPTLTSGSDTITAATILNDDDGSAGTEQFAMGITTNGNCSITSGYNATSPADYKFEPSTTTVICSETSMSAAETISSYYISNIASNTEAGSYASDITYIMTGNY